MPSGGSFIDPYFNDHNDPSTPAPPDTPGVPTGEEPLIPADVAQQFLAALLGLTAPDEEDPVFVPGGDNAPFFAFIQEQDTILDNLKSMFIDELKVQMEGLGYPTESGKQAFAYWGQEYGDWIDGWLQQANVGKQNWDKHRSMLPGDDQAAFGGLQDPRTMGMDYYLGTLQGFDDMVKAGWDWWRQRVPGLTNFGSFVKPKKPTGGGRRRPSKQDIRDAFDIDQLTDATRGIWQQMLLTSPSNARDIASSYIEAVVAVRAEKEIDFTTFVKNKARDTARYRTIYEGKPPALSEEQFLQPYHAAAMQVARPDDAAGIAIGGAQFGASSSSFAQRLRRTDDATSSAPFVSEMQNRLTDLKGVLRG